jgi:penicillin-binding protein activator
MKFATSATVRAAGLALAALMASGCGGTKVSRVTHDSVIDLSGRWNDTDSRLVAEEMLRDCLAAPWYSTYASQERVPTVIVGEVRNRSHEHINAETFVKDMERYLINSGKVDFVASRGERDQLREEKADQATGASVETRQKAGEETGAELMLLGSINSIVDKEGGRSVVFYQVNLELVNIGTGRKLWIGDKKIKKYVTRSSTSL